MGERRRRRGIDGDERASGGPGAAGTLTRGHSGGSNVTDHVLGLQRDYGNAAVTTVVQRKERPQSTDAPWVKKKPKPKPGKVTKEPVIEDLRPKSADKEYSTWEDARLEGWIKDHGETAKGSTAKQIAQMWEELYWRKPNWMMGLNISRAWKKVPDDKKAKFWLDWFNSKGKLLDPKPESQVGKEF